VKGEFPMPTQEERLTALERNFTAFQKEAGQHIRETEENTTIMLGVMRSQGQDIKRAVQRLETIDERLETMDERLDAIEQRLNPVEQHLETIDGRLNAIDGRLDAMEQRFDRLETKFDEHTVLLTQILARLPEKP